MRSALRARNKLLLRAAALALALAFIGIGLARQGKAVKICLECIGIG